MWRYRAKTDLDGYVHTLRSRLVGRGYSQVVGVNYDLILFSPVARMVTFRVVIAVIVKLRLVLYEGDIDTAYLNASLQIRQHLNQALHGLHESGAEWFAEVDKFLKSQGFHSTETEPCLYARYQEGLFSLIPLYVDDVVLATNSAQYKTALFAAFDKKYGLKDGGKEKYCSEVLELFGFDATHGSATPMETNAKFTSRTEDDEVSSFDYRAVIGSLMYLATSKRPDIAFSVGYLSRFVSNTSKKHCGAVRQIMRYLVATKRQGTKFSGGKEKLADKINSIIGFVRTIIGGAVVWAARRQTITALSTAEAKCVAGFVAMAEVHGITNMLDEVLKTIQIYTELTLGVDNNAAITLAKHLLTAVELVILNSEQITKGLLELYKVDDTHNLADMLTKALPMRSLAKYRDDIGMSSSLESGSS
ncbi:Integrase, catalytic core protein [Phytophthora megakarya]|uniref:Integrase, catalytic core protein n=1 Tax=Phytophthora megakarya TaxID=4795 RepID=A0A225WF89_9STRA|nr:Integrase, catalytic core protein [Phytophthora megakarya]